MSQFISFVEELKKKSISLSAAYFLMIPLNVCMFFPLGLLKLNRIQLCCLLEDSVTRC